MRSRVIKFMLCAAAVLSGAASFEASSESLQQLTPRIPHTKPFFSALKAHAVKESITFKLREGESAVVVGNRLVGYGGSDLSEVIRVLDTIRGVGVKPVFSSPHESLKDQKMKGEAASGTELADLTLYFSARLPASVSVVEAEAFVSMLNSLPAVEIAYFDHKPAPLPAADILPPTPSFEHMQGYLTPAPVGVDAFHAWTYPGGRGANVKIIDIESAWNTSHEDLNAPFVVIGTPRDDSFSLFHGTAALGVMVAQANGYGVTGIANQAAYGLSVYNGFNAPDAINLAGQALSRGDIILIEAQTSSLAPSEGCGSGGLVPLEFQHAAFDAISQQTALGRIVVEPAGNGGVFLDNPALNGFFSRKVRDSGAIIVGAGMPNTLAPTCFTSFGSRVDVQGWGESVATTGSFPGFGELWNVNDGNQFYTGGFRGTSSASPIVAGAAASLQGFFRARRGASLSPAQMRFLLANYGTPQQADARKIGPLPNLRAAIDAVVGPPRLMNVSSRALVLTGDYVMIAGLIVGGSGSKQLVVRARGPSMVSAGITNPLWDPVLTLVNNMTGQVMDSNDNWRSAPNAGALEATGLAPTDDRESALLLKVLPGSYSAIVSGANWGTGIGAVDIFEIDVPSGPPLVNLSTRAGVYTGDNVLIGGFIIDGNGPLKVVVRARGPSMFIPNPLPDPVLVLVNSLGQVIAFNDNWWTAANASELSASGLAPSDWRESALLITLNPGAYTAVIYGANNVTGTGIFEVFAR